MRATLKPVGRPPAKVTNGVTWGVGSLTAVSKDEVWASVAYELFRFREGSWQSVGITSECIPVPASDGAIWIVTSKGLTRVDGDRIHVVAPSIRAERFPECPQLQAGPTGSMWLNRVGQIFPVDLAESAEVVQYQIDGAHRSIGKPAMMEEVCLEAAGEDGSVWVSQWWLTQSNDADEMACERLKGGYARWDGRKWTLVGPPEGTQPTAMRGGVAITDDGAAWPLLVMTGTYRTSQPQFALGRYADGRWRLVSPGGAFGGGLPADVVAVSEARTCTRVYGRDSVQFDASTSGQPFTSIRCFDATGEVSRISTLDVGIVTDVSIATDGGTWVKLAPDEEIARLTVAKQ